MEKRYADWIDAYVARHHGHVVGHCGSATLEMVEVFPELTRVPGFVHMFGEHWWCVSPSGEIIDPTASQFPIGLTPIYEPWKPGDEIRVGKCMECGGDIYDTPQVLGVGKPTFCLPYDGQKISDCEQSYRNWADG